MPRSRAKQGRGNSGIKVRVWNAETKKYEVKYNGEGRPLYWRGLHTQPSNPLRTIAKRKAREIYFANIAAEKKEKAAKEAAKMRALGGF